jgi:hypothetical protein
LESYQSWAKSWENLGKSSTTGNSWNLETGQIFSSEAEQNLGILKYFCTDISTGRQTGNLGKSDRILKNL